MERWQCKAFCKFTSDTMTISFIFHFPNFMAIVQGDEVSGHIKWTHESKLTMLSKSSLKHKLMHNELIRCYNTIHDTESENSIDY